MTTNWIERFFRERSQDVSQWCSDNGYTDLFYQNGEWWAFPPNAVMPVQVYVAMGQERSPF